MSTADETVEKTFDDALNEILRKIRAGEPTNLSGLDRYAERLNMEMSKEEILLCDSFVRHFAIETSNILGDAEKMAMFRDLEHHVKMNCYIHGVVTALVTILSMNVSGRVENQSRVAGALIKVCVDMAVKNNDTAIRNSD